MKISDLISRWLVDIGCRNVYGVTGGSVVHLLHSAEKNERLSVIYNHHEQASAFAAVASSRIFHDRPGVCMVTTGPGGTNAITGLASAWLDSIPTIFISGQARSNDAEALKSTRQSGSQHLDIVNVVKPLTNYCATARSENIYCKYYILAERSSLAKTRSGMDRHSIRSTVENIRFAR